MTSLRLVHVVASLVAAASIGCSIDVRGSETSQREEKRFPLSGSEPAELNLRTFDGAIQVRSWDKNEVLVEIERRGPDQASIDALTVNTSQEGNRVVVEAQAPRGERRGSSFGNWGSFLVILHVSPTRPIQSPAR